ncbi:hypothetical protein EJ04DRAFT_598839 [Polyplosphaeria fusca]|uniref:Uncharacterized protein n=1 Tax=Polyplosphaeria fusca TaxID=682080 RepID=A0A9P4V188_9PLEO|nr:hypothetical protein EJ04DRAFT_598839 [Polyplosphaeria fusca]
MTRPFLPPLSTQSLARMPMPLPRHCLHLLFHIPVVIQERTIMPPQYPSIQSYYSSSTAKSSSSQLPPSPLPSSSTGHQPGDGFTAEELETSVQPLSAQWTPPQKYEEIEIGLLEPGPKHLTFKGRVVNFYNQLKPSKKPQAAQGLLKIMVGDHTGAITIRLYYSEIDYKVHLGQLVTVFTVHISHGEQASLAPTAAPLFTSIFPERERSTYAMFYENDDDDTAFRRPPGCEGNPGLSGLMTLKNFTNGGYDVDDCKLLVCVKSIGARKKYTNKKGFTSELINVGVFDDTADASLTLYASASASPSYWQPSRTVLLISNPAWRIDRIAKLSLGPNARIDVDPDMADALWLRSLAQRLTKREHVNPPFPEGMFDLEAAESAPVRILYTLAEIDELYASITTVLTNQLTIPALAQTQKRFTGYISVLLTTIDLVSNLRSQRLMSTECCGIPLYANATTATCPQCNTPTPLRLNPKILGPILDETAQLQAAKFLFSDTAWTQLLGRTPQQLVETPVDVLKGMELRMRFVRVSMGFGWCVGEVGRLCIWCVKP